MMGDYAQISDEREASAIMRFVNECLNFYSLRENYGVINYVRFAN